MINKVDQEIANVTGLIGEQFVKFFQKFDVNYTGTVFCISLSNTGVTKKINISKFVKIGSVVAFNMPNSVALKDFDAGC